MNIKLFKILSFLGIIIFVIVCLLFALNYNKPKLLNVSYLDVGQGDSFLIKTPYGQNIIIDGGSDDSITHGLSRNLPWWDRTIDLMVLTHPHDDHVSGLNDVLKRYNIKKIAYTGVVHNSPNYIAWLNLIKTKKIPIFIIDKPRKIIFGKDCELDIIYPTNSLLNTEMENINNSSIVAKLVYKDTKFLYTGDIEKVIEEKLILSKVDLSAQVLKIAHHGSDTSSVDDFLKKVKPDIAVISVGKDNKFNHPNGRIFNRLERLGVRIFRTDLDGEVDLVSDGVKVYKK